MMQLGSLIEGLDASLISGKLDVDIKGLSIDSRLVRPGDFYIALPGLSSDGHDYIKSAFEKGAVGALVQAEKGTDGVSLHEEHRILVQTTSSRALLPHLVRRFFDEPSERLTTIGVTGTNGKTSVVHMLREALCALSTPCASVGTLGLVTPQASRYTGMTTPDIMTLNRWLSGLNDIGVRHVAMEVSSHALHQERVAATDFDVAVFTNLSHEHLDYHGSLEEYFNQKKRLFTERLKPDATAILNIDDPALKPFADALERARPDVKVRRMGAHALSNTMTTLDGVGFQIGTHQVKSELIGRFHITNLHLTWGVLEALGFDSTQRAHALSGVVAVPGRMQRVGSYKPYAFIDFAHTPEALAAALQTLAEHCRGKLRLIFGCGGERDLEKRPMMGRIAAKYADDIVVTNDNPRSEDPQKIADAIIAGARSDAPETLRLRVILDRKQAILDTVTNAAPDDCVLIAGRGHETKQWIGKEGIDFNDMNVTQDIFRDLS